MTSWGSNNGKFMCADAHKQLVWKKWYELTLMVDQYYGGNWKVAWNRKSELEKKINEAKILTYKTQNVSVEEI